MTAKPGLIMQYRITPGSARMVPEDRTMLSKGPQAPVVFSAYIKGITPEYMVIPGGFEPPAPRLGIWCSILLSYGTIAMRSRTSLAPKLRRVNGA
jgi:hypothetical protein